MADAEAKRKYNQEYRERNRERLIQKDHEYAMTHREQKQKSNREHYEKNAEAMREYAREYRRTHSEAIKAQHERRKQNSPYHTWSEEQKRASRERNKRWRENHRAEYLASCARQNKNKRERYKNDPEYRERQKVQSRKIMPAWQRKRRAELKDAVFSHYGYICVCCGETNLTFLTIDHVNSDGAQHRKKLGRGGHTVTMYRDIIKRNFPPDFQILCYNCNCGRARNNGICPHQTPASAALSCDTLIADAAI